MEKIIVNPLNVRGLGNVVDADNTLGEYNSHLTTVTDLTYGSVWNSEYLTGSYIILSYDKVIASIGDLTVSLTLKDNTDTVIGSVSVSCYFNGETYTATTNSSGVASFTLPVTETGHHTFKVVYSGTNSIAGCIKLGSFYCGELESIELISTNEIFQDDDTIHLIGLLSPDVPGVSINFYEIYTPTTLTVSSDKTIFQSGETATIKAVLRDEDGSRIKGETIYFYDDSGYVPPAPASVSLTADTNILSYYNSESATLSATVRDEHNHPVIYTIVEFFKNGTSLGTATTNGNGVATKTYSSTGSGDVSFTATASGVTSSPVTIEDCVYYNTSAVAHTTTNESTIYDNDMSITLPSKCEVSFDFWSNNTQSGEHRFFLLPKSQFSTDTTQPQYGLFADQKGGNIGSLGKREDNSTVTTYANFSVTGSTWHTVKWVKDNTKVLFYIDTTLKGNQTLSWIDNYSNWCFSMIRWTCTGTSIMKNVKIKAL